MTEQEQRPERREFDGSRWINYRPSAEEVSEWFTKSFSIDPALQHEDYIGGVVLIPAVETRAKYVTGFTNAGVPIIEDREELSYNPYARVETRLKYWWDLLGAHPEWTGVVEHVTSPRISPDPVVEAIEAITTAEAGAQQPSPSQRRETTKYRQPGAMAQLVHQLPDGFSIMSVPVGQGYTHFLCCTIRVSIYDREALEKTDGGLAGLVPLRTGRGTKQVPLLLGRNTVYADASSLMKCETGALGRALGAAGIFVLSGSGVATAEDVQEALSQGAPPSQAAPENTGPAAPEQAPVRTGAEAAQDEEGELHKRASTLWAALQAERPEQAEVFAGWARERGLRGLGDARGAMLRGVVKKLERLSEPADQPTAPPESATAAEEASDVPAEATAAEPSGPPA